MASARDSKSIPIENGVITTHSDKRPPNQIGISAPLRPFTDLAGNVVDRNEADLKADTLAATLRMIEKERKNPPIVSKTHPIATSSAKASEIWPEQESPKEKLITALGTCITPVPKLFSETKIPHIIRNIRNIFNTCCTSRYHT